MTIAAAIASSTRTARQFAGRGLATTIACLLLTSCGEWRGIANVPLPGEPGAGGRHITVYVQMPDTLALNVNSLVRVADVVVGSVRAIELKNWVATMTVDLTPGVKLPTNAVARIGQTSLLGAQHLELAAPQDPSPTPLKSGDTIPLKNSTAFPTTERVLASIATVLKGGGIPELEVIQREANDMLTGHADQIREFLGRLDTFTAELNSQRSDLIRAIDSTDRLLTMVVQHSDTYDALLREFTPLIKHFADTQRLFTQAVEALGRVSSAVDAALAPSEADLHANLELSQSPLNQLGRAAPYLVKALRVMLTEPFDVNNIPKVIRGDYVNMSLVTDLTLSTLDNGMLTGTGFSGALRALEQAWGRDPNTMLPDVRFTPNPHDAPNGPLVERGE
ncbi:MCE family protein [Mycolicibacterium sp. CBM1]